MEPATDRKITTTITLAPSLREQLDAAAVAADRPRSWIAATAIREWLARQAERAE
jgi:predicted transcriptional regulator